MKTNYQLYNINNYNIARKNLSICNVSDISKYTIYGPNSIDLLNKFSIRNIFTINDNTFMTLMMYKKKFLCECQIIKLSTYKYICLVENGNTFYKYLRKYQKKFPLVTIEDSTKDYSFFSFHGEKALEYFSNKNSSNLYLLSRQNYKYYTMLTTKNNETIVLNHFKEIGFIEINQYVRDIFLFNNNVITNLDKIKYKYKDNVYSYIYKNDYLNKKKKQMYIVKQYEATKNFIYSKNIPIYNSKRKKIGYIHNFYRIKNKKYPYFLGIVKKSVNEKVALLKINKKEILVKEYQTY